MVENHWRMVCECVAECTSVGNDRKKVEYHWSMYSAYHVFLSLFQQGITEPLEYECIMCS